MKVLLALLMAAYFGTGCANASHSTDDGNLQLLVDLDGDDLPVVANGAAATFPLRCRNGTLWGLDTSAAYGNPKYVDAAHGQNGHAGWQHNRGEYPRVIALQQISSYQSDWTFAMVINATTPNATATTRGYLLTSTDSPGVEEGTRFALGYNENALGGNFNHLAYADDNFENEQVNTTNFPGGVNRAWHVFYPDGDWNKIPLTTIGGAQVLIWSLGERSFLMRNGVIVGREIFGKFRQWMRALSVKVILGSENDAVPGDTTTFFDGIYYKFLWFRGAASPTQARALLIDPRYQLSKYGL